MRILLAGASGFLGAHPLPCKRWVFDALIAVIRAYSAIIAVCLPEFLHHPFAPVVNNLVLLAAIWLLRQRARED